MCIRDSKQTLQNYDRQHDRYQPKKRMVIQRAPEVSGKKAHKSTGQPAAGTRKADGGHKETGVTGNRFCRRHVKR